MVRSPDFNPIEGVFSMIKHHYKKNQDFDKATVIPNVIKSIQSITTTDVRK